MKTCNRCEETKDLSEFSKNGRSPDGLHSMCKVCNRKRGQEYYQKRKQGYSPRKTEKLTARDSHLRRTYGITEQQYNELLFRQRDRCAVCEKHKDDEKKSLSVDHDHHTGEIRGLLCTMCNYRHVGRHRDANLLRRIASYLEQGTGWFVPPKKPKKRKRKKNTLFEKGKK